MSGKSAQQWIDELELARHPEGGWFRRVYESELTVDGSRPAMSSIYYLLESGDFSALHRLKSDEQWHFYHGAPITIHMLDAGGRYTQTTLGTKGPFQCTVKAGQLFGATVGNGYALVGCTVAPGFDYSGFELPARGTLLRDYPLHAEMIGRLTR
ncbi:MAG: cupin domain-containing protein [Kiritimatiellales bacterium]|nr:cupin domain-containing protein [Kiritimatiellales bacterium]MCF7864451.1 cupin domain-containing protein [Kiritimatiellales bacterium]